MKNNTFALYIGYIDKVLFHARIDYLRKMKRINDHEVFSGEIPEVMIQERFDPEEQSLDQITEDVKLKAAFESLNENEATILFRLICMEQPLGSVARELRMTNSNVCRIRKRALKKLHDILSGGIGDGGF